MKTIENLSTLKDNFPKYKKTLILLGGTPNLDTIASALGIMLVLKKAGIDAQVASDADMRVEFSRLVGVDSVKKHVANRNLVVSFPYSENQVEKVSYNITEDGKRFNLVISPKTGATPLDPSQIAYDYAGVEADLIIMIGVGSYQELGSVYETDRNTIEEAMTVALTLFPVPTFAQVHADAQGLSGLSELGVTLLSQLGLSLDNESASNFLYGIESATQGLTAPTLNADTFEAIATLMRAGGRRQPLAPHAGLSPNQMPFLRPAQPMQQQPPQPAPQAGNGSNNPFAQALNNSQQNPMKTQAGAASMTGELKG